MTLGTFRGAVGRGAGAPAATATHWRYRRGGEPVFDPVIFDEHALAARGALAGRAGAGRGNTFFVTLDGHELVLRHYRRGGLARRFSERRYLWSGVARTRAVREFELLRELETAGLPVPAPFACAVNRHGPFWSGSLVTRRLPGRTLAETLEAAGADGLDAGPWASIGRCIARFHRAGIRHADLNAHNVMLDGERVHLLDFDRATRRAVGTGGGRGAAEPARWQRANLARLRRSLAKLAAARGATPDAAGFASLETAWREALLGRDQRSSSRAR